MTSPNIPSLARVARALKPLQNDVVFVGGHIPELLTNEPGTRIRPTTDIDIVASITTKTAYYKLGERLRALGLREDIREGAPACRWITHEGDVVDVMPSSGDVLSFSNPWYADALATASLHPLEPNLDIRIPSPAVFLATKFAAYQDRGANDVLGSHDLEDIIVVVAGRSSIVDDVGAASPPVREWLATQSSLLLANANAEDAIAGALPDARLIPDLIARTLDRFQRIAQGGVL